MCATGSELARNGLELEAYQILSSHPGLSSLILPKKSAMGLAGYAYLRCFLNQARLFWKAACASLATCGSLSSPFRVLCRPQPLSAHRCCVQYRTALPASGLHRHYDRRLLAPQGHHKDTALGSTSHALPLGSTGTQPEPPCCPGSSRTARAFLAGSARPDKASQQLLPAASALQDQGGRL